MLSVANKDFERSVLPAGAGAGAAAGAGALVESSVPATVPSRPLKPSASLERPVCAEVATGVDACMRSRTSHNFTVLSDAPVANLWPPGWKSSV
jgi:hypothetical protein